MTDPDSDLEQPLHDLRAEQAAIGAAIQNVQAFTAVVDACPPERFYRPAHGKILDAALGLYATGQPIDPVAVAAELDRRGQLAGIGGHPYLHTLYSTVPTGANAAYYAEIVADKAVLRDLDSAATYVAQLARTATDDPIAAVERARGRLDTIAAGARTEDAVWSAGTLASRALERYRSPAPDGIPTGWRDLDRVLPAGLRPGTLVVVGARPKVGKSMLGVALPLQVAQSGRPAAIVSLEMPEAELTDRLIAQMSGIGLDALQRCALSASDWSEVERAADRLRALPLTILDNKRQTLTSISSRIRDLRRGVGCDLLVVDYLGLVTPAERRQNRQEEVAGISRGLKILAGELGVPVVALAQINRGPEQRAERRPLPSDLRESGAIEADADQVWLLHRDPESEGEIEVNIAYNRHGPSATVYLAWQPRLARVRDLIRFADHERAS